MGNLGNLAYRKWKKGIKLSRQQQINAHCWECNVGSESGEDCLGEKSCPLYPYSPSAQRRGFKRGFVLTNPKIKGNLPLKGDRPNSEQLAITKHTATDKGIGDAK